MKKHRLCLITVAMMAAGCTTYQHPEPTQAKDALKQAMKRLVFKDEVSLSVVFA